jgi:N6-adenosine-specific RNA methylase IME4
MIPFPDKKYSIIYADPPWSYDNDPPSRSVTNHYGVMTLDDICALPVKEISEKNAMLFLWTTITHLRECFNVIDSWGFEYKSNIVWDKQIAGTGYWTRSQHEFLMICKKGNIKCPLPENISPSLYSEKRKEHSKKPRYFRSMIERQYPNLTNRIELFSRDKIEGWDCWGNEVPTSEQKLLIK